MNMKPRKTEQGAKEEERWTRKNKNKIKKSISVKAVCARAAERKKMGNHI